MECFTFENEDHTLGSLLQEELLENSDVVFAGYIVENPLEKIIKLKIQTKMNQIDEEFPKLNADKTSPSPREVLRESIDNLIEQLNDMEEIFKESFNSFNSLNTS